MPLEPFAPYGDFGREQKDDARHKNPMEMELREAEKTEEWWTELTTTDSDWTGRASGICKWLMHTKWSTLPCTIEKMARLALSL